MKKIKESIGSDLKSSIQDEIMNISSFDVDPTEAMKSISSYTKDISEEEDDNDGNIKKNKNRKMSSKKSKQSETKEATSAGGAGQFSQPLFSTTKKEMEEKVKKGGDKDNVKKVEATEATSSSSSGQYSTPAFVAKDSKNWRGNKKPQIPGGKFVKIKDKCKKFPYCNQGDITALKIFENKVVIKAIKSICEKYQISENVVKSIIVHEYENKNQNN